jgi:hypothetical protein
MGILPNCKDPTLKALKSIGYNVVQLPRVDLHPTQLMVSDNKRLKRLGEISSVFTAGQDAPPLPPIGPDQPGPSIAITKSAALDLGVALNILGGLISALGGSTLGLNLAYSKAHKIEMEYSGTLENSAQLALIDAFLSGATVNPFATATKQMLEADMVYVITSTLRANKLTVKATDEKKNSVGIDVPVLAQAIGGNLKVSGSGANSTTVTFEGTIPLAFAFQAVKLIFDNGSYRSMKLIDGGGVIGEATNQPAMIEDDYILRG